MQTFTILNQKNKPVNKNQQLHTDLQIYMPKVKCVG